MDADKVVMHGVDGNRVCVVLDLLGKGVRQAREPARSHAERKVGPLGVGRADVRRIGTAFHAAQLNARAVAGDIAAQRAYGCAVVLDEHGIVDVRAERLLYRLQVGLVSVAGELHPVCQPSGQIGNERLRRISIPSADVERRDQLGVGVNRHPRPAVASALRRGLGRLDVLGLGIDERPNFIDLDPLAGEAAQGAILIVAERLPSVR